MQGRLDALHKADPEPFYCSLMVAKAFELYALEHRLSPWIIVQGLLLRSVAWKDTGVLPKVPQAILFPGVDF